MQLPGTPSDEAAEILAAGRGEITTLFVSMATRHPDGLDAEYLRWHTLDHRPEQHRLAAVRASLRLVSTPACRSARTISGGALDRVDHVMAYFFTDPAGLRGFNELSSALGNAGRKLPLLPPVERGVYEVLAKAAAPRVKVGRTSYPGCPCGGCSCWLSGDRLRRTRWRRWPVSPAYGPRHRGRSTPIWRALERARTSRIASSMTIPSPPRNGCGRCCGPAGRSRMSNRSSPHRFSRWCRLSGTAMCHRSGAACASA